MTFTSMSTCPRRSGFVLAVLYLAVSTFGSAACSGGSNEASSESNLEKQLLRERAAGLWIENRRIEALEVLTPLVEVAEPEYEDLLNVGILTFAMTGIFTNDQRYIDELEAETTELLTRASALRPDEAAPFYNIGVLNLRNGELEVAEANLAKAHELDPDDYQTHLHYANTLLDLDKLEEAELHYRQLKEIGVGTGKGMYVSVIYRLGQLLSWSGLEEGPELIRESQRLKETGLEPPRSEPARIGVLGQISWPRARGFESERGATSYQIGESVQTLPSELAGMRGLASWTISENWTRTDALSEKDPEEDEEDDLYAPTQAPKATDVGLPDVGGWGPNGLVIALHQSDGSYQAHSLTTDPVRFARAFDYDNDGDLDVLAVTEEGVRLYRTDGLGDDLAWELSSVEFPALSSLPRDVAPVDFDHEGDIDLLVVGEFGARLWRNDGLSVTQVKEHAKERDDARAKKGLEREAQDEENTEESTVEIGSWVDATVDSKLPTNKRFDWCVVEDFDTDQDVDLLLGGSEGVFLADSLRGGVFADRSTDLSSAAHQLGKEPIVADLNGDAWPDLWIRGSDQAQLFIRTPGGKYISAAAGGGAAGKVEDVGSIDLNGDGYLDATWTREGGGAGYALSIGAGSKAPADVNLLDGALATVWDDFDGDGAIDALSSFADRAELKPGVGETGANSIRLALFAKERDNRRGVGAIVELRAGPIYRRIFWTGEPMTLGLGAEASAGILRVTWPRGVEQHDFDVASGSRWMMSRINRVEGSCPFLYTWNGKTFEFITDVLGITPLGLPMAPGMMVPPDHDEYVLVRGEQMKPRVGEDGKAYFEMQFTEELREVTYLDRLRLEVVDHPEGTEIFPNERFSFPPFPEAHTHVMRDPLLPTSAIDHRGTDWTETVASIDGDYAIPFEPYRGLLTGLAKPHTLELSFDPEQLKDAELLRLVCTGWFLWSDASINIAAARTPGVDFIPPILQVPDATAEDGWRAVGPPVGFPAGKRKTMVLDVTDFIDPADPRIRIFGTLCIYWDSIRLATDNDDEPLVVTHVEPSSANLWQRGFSRSMHPIEGHMLEWFDWDELDEARWNQHPGSYTKLGEVLPLMTAIDDKYAIMGAGDALHARFSAEGLPDLQPGWRRDYLVFLDGWAKDRDPNSIEALYVEPLPFHGMSGYPYREDESFPNDQEHNDWRREWNTRPSRRWIEELAPGRNPAIALW